MNIWERIQDAEYGNFLQQNGFYINCRDSEGYTPLMLLVKNPIDLEALATIETLLKCGADPRLTTIENGLKINALDLTSNTLVKKLLESYFGKIP